jgi:hypothetical protein
MAAPAEAGRVRLQIPPFAGTPRDKGEGESFLAARLWVARVAAFRTVSQLSDEETARAASFAFQGEALEWYTNLMLARNAARNRWSTLEPLFLERFSVRTTPGEKARMAAGLRQRPKETVAAFRDRCEAVQHAMEQDIPDDERTGDMLDAFNRRHDAEVLIKFLCGLREAGGLQEKVAAARATTLTEYYEEALRVKRAHREAGGGAAAPIAAVESVEEPAGHDQEVAAFQAGRGRGGGGGASRGAPGGGGAGRGAAGNGGRVICYWCAKPGHITRNCRAKLAGMPRAANAPGPANWGEGNNGGGGPNQRGPSAGMAGNPNAGNSPSWVNAMQERLVQLGLQQLGLAQPQAPQGGGNPFGSGFL